MNKIIYVGKHTLTFSVSRHVHTSYELICCTGGEGQIILDGSVLNYSKNNIAVIPPMTPHINISDKGFTNVFINITDFTSSVNDPLIIPNDDNPYFINAFQAAFFYYAGNDPKRDELLTLYGDLIAAFVSSYMSSRKKNSVAEQIERNIIENYMDPAYDLGEYLHSLPFSYDYLSRLFKKTFGSTPHRYMTAKRLQAAAAKLSLNEARDITDTARSTGFNDPLYFSRLFKKYYGVSPSAYKVDETDRADDPDSMKIFLKD